MKRWIAVTATGRHYWKRNSRPGVFGRQVSWTTTTDIEEAHRFRSKRAAEKFNIGLPGAHVLEVEKETAE